MSKKEYLYPMEVQLYQKIKWFTTKGELHCCCVSNEKLGELLGGRNKASVSRTISKLINLGYIEYKQKNPRQLITTSKEMIFNDYKVVISNDETVIDNDKVVINDDKVVISNDETVIDNDKVVINDDKVVNLISLLNDETVIATMTKLLLSDDETVNHKNIFKEKIYKNIFKLLSTKEDNNIEKINKKENLDFIQDELKPVYQEWLKYRKEIKKPLKETSIKANYNQLIELANNNIETAKAIINQSIANGWQGLFELKQQNYLKPKGNYNNFNGSYGNDIPL